jgi:hypothetical protein
MTRAHVVHWACTCGARGDYPTTGAPKTDSALPCAKHQKTCRGSVSTSTRAELVAQIATMAGRLA